MAQRTGTTPAIRQCPQTRCQPTSQRWVTEAPFSIKLDPEAIKAMMWVTQALGTLGHSTATTVFGDANEFLGPCLQVLSAGGTEYRDSSWTRTDEFMQRNREAAETVSSLDCVRSVADLQRWTPTFLAPWGLEFDRLMTPTMSIQSPPAGSVLEELHNREGASSSAPGSLADGRLYCALFNGTGFNRTGQPAISLPAHLSATRVSVGVHLVTLPFDELAPIELSTQLAQALG